MDLDEGSPVSFDFVRPPVSVQGLSQVVEEPSDILAALHTAVLILVCALASQPEQVSVELITDQRSLYFQIRTADEDFGQIIGKQGRTARALRILLQAAGRRLHQNVIIDIDTMGNRGIDQPAVAQVPRQDVKSFCTMGLGMLHLVPRFNEESETVRAGPEKDGLIADLSGPMS